MVAHIHELQAHAKRAGARGAAHGWLNHRGGRGLLPCHGLTRCPSHTVCVSQVFGGQASSSVRQASSKMHRHCRMRLVGAYH